MDDGARVPDCADGMGCFLLPSGQIALVRNHELLPTADGGGGLGPAYDYSAPGVPLPGGTTTILLNPSTLAVERQFRSLSGTIRNCAGGVTPWGSWLSCEEDVSRAGTTLARDHGWVFEVSATATGVVDPVPLTAMGRFNHEAACVDPSTGFVYLTEDREDGLLYRFVPNKAGRLADGGKLQALGALSDLTDSRNWSGAVVAVGQTIATKWIDLDDVASPADDLRYRGLKLGGLRFARGEGIHMGSGELFFCCTSGGAARIGQVFRLSLSATGDRLQLFYEASTRGDFAYGDNLTVAPDGQLIICEDQDDEPVDNHLRVIGKDGRQYPLARLRERTELAGACFSPDGRYLFVNAYSPARTLAVWGPWAHLT